MTTENKETQLQPGFVLEKFHFKEKKENGVVVEPKRPSFEAAIPAIDAQSIVDIIYSEQESDERKEKFLSYLARLHNDQVFKAAQAQITAKLASFSSVADRVAYQLQPSDIDVSKLDVWTLTYTEPAQRGAGKQFSDELVNEAAKSFLEFGASTFKRDNGSPISREGLIKTTDEIFKNKFKNTKTDKDSINLFKDRITLWFASLQPELQNAYAGYTQHLLEKIENYLNPSQTSTIGKFE